MSQQRFLKHLRFALTAAVFALLVSAPLLAQEGNGRKVKTQIKPHYPEIAKKMRVSGAVRLEVVIAPNGTIKDVKPLGGHPVLIDAATDAVKKWKYEPASDEAKQTIVFNFTPNS